MDDKKSRDLKDVMKEEGRRSRRPHRVGAAEKGKALATEGEFIEAIRAFGLIEGTQEFSEALDAWRAFRP